MHHTPFEVPPLSWGEVSRKWQRWRGRWMQSTSGSFLRSLIARFEGVLQQDTVNTWFFFCTWYQKQPHTSFSFVLRFFLFWHWLPLWIAALFWMTDAEQKRGRANNRISAGSLDAVVVFHWGSELACSIFFGGSGRDETGQIFSSILFEVGQSWSKFTKKMIHLLIQYWTVINNSHFLFQLSWSKADSALKRLGLLEVFHRAEEMCFLQLWLGDATQAQQCDKRTLLASWHIAHL